MDPDSEEWLRGLRGDGAVRQEAEARLHALLVKASFKEAHRRAASARLEGPDLEELAYQSANDAMVSVLRRLEDFRGESRFTTWVYRFAILEVSNKLARRRAALASAAMPLEAEDWERLPERFGDGPEESAQQRELVSAVRAAVRESLTPRQRELFVASVVHGEPTDALAARLGTSLGAVYKTMFDARKKLRAALDAQGLLDGGAPGRTGRAKVTKP